MLISSGVYTPIAAIAALASRWADAIAFTIMLTVAALLAAVQHTGIALFSEDLNP